MVETILGKRERDGQEVVQADKVDGVAQSAVGNNEDDDSDDDVGPMPAANNESAPRKKQKKLLHEKLYLDHLPSASRYHKSFMHRDVINFVVVTKTDFIITTSVDGHIKLWKKQDVGIEFVKDYRAHISAVIAVAASADGQSFASMSEDGSAKIFDVVNFDMINMIKLDYTPLACCWVHRQNQARGLLAISEESTGIIRIYDGRGDGVPLETLSNMHRAPVHIMTYSDLHDCVISVDTSGFIEYWCPTEPFGLPKSVRSFWELKSSTDLYEFKKTKNVPTTLSISPDSNFFATFSIPDRQIRVFNFFTAKMIRKYDESLAAIQEMQQAGTSVYKVDDMEFGRRLAAERELESNEKILRTMNIIWDESCNFIIYPTLLGLKVVNVVSNKVSRLLGQEETARWLNLAMYQGAPKKKGITTVAMAASDNPILAEKGTRDPILFCTGYKRQRFYMFTSDQPDNNKERDIFNERPTQDEAKMALATPSQNSGPSPVAYNATIHTSVGDIHIQLFPDQAPKTVENFVGHSRSGYFERVIFHRVIPKFMIQTGDPLGDGTGGESIWGREFEDEFHPMLKHDRPYCLSMANAGPGTNGSQFFITVVPAPWLDKKHTIFGRVTDGFEVVHAIENVRVNKADKPFEDIRITNVSIL